MSSATSRWIRYALPFFVALGIFWPATKGSFVLDDLSYVVNNPSVIGDAGIFDSALPPDRKDLGLYRPITVATYRAQYAISGMDAIAFRRGNVLLHAATSALVVPAVMALGASAPLAIIAATLFAIHPVHVEAVAWIVGRAEILATLFALLALILSSRSFQFDPRRTFAASICLLLAGLSKESALPFAGVLVLVDLLRRVPHRVVLARTACYAGALAIIVVLRISVLDRFGPEVSTHPILSGISLLERSELAVRILGFSLRSLLVPDELSIWYEPRIFGGAVRLALGLAVVFAALAFLAHAVRSKQRLTGIGFGWFMLAMLPFLHLIPIAWVFGDRFLYLASAGFTLGCCAAVAELKLPRAVLTALIVLVMPTFSGLTLARIPVFRDDRSLWEDAIAKDPNSGFSHFQLAGILEESARFDYRSEDDRGAVYHWQESLRVHPDHLYCARSHAKLGDYFAFVVRDLQRGLSEYREAFRIDPEAKDPLVLDSLIRFATLREITSEEAIDSLEIATKAANEPGVVERLREAIAYVATRTDLEEPQRTRLTTYSERVRSQQ